MRIGASVAVALAAFLAARTAGAYGRVTSKDGIPYHWEESCITLTPATGPAEDLGPTDLVVGAWAAALSWSRSTVPCTYLRISVDPPSERAGRVAADGTNSVVMREQRWCREAASPDDPEECYDQAALAVTSFFARERDARIFDADVEVNGVQFQWALLDGDGDPRGRASQDLANTLTHELGHVIGLDHNCFVPGSTRARAKDGMGVEIPDCQVAGPELREATMFFSARTGDLSKRSLAEDDRRALCESYPLADDPHRCQPAELPGTGCSTAPGPRRAPRAPAAVLAALGALVLVTRRACSRSRRS